MTRNSFRKLSFILTAVVLSGTLYLSTTYATLAPLTPPPSGGYDAGTNSILDPGCGPTDTDCFVKPITADNGLTATGSNVQLGGILMQNTLIDQDGNDFAILNGNFSFQSAATTSIGVPGLISAYNDSTTNTAVGVIDLGAPADKFPAMFHSYDNGSDITSSAYFFNGITSGGIYSSSIAWSTTYQSSTEHYESEMNNIHRRTYFQNKNLNSGLKSLFIIDSDNGISFTFGDNINPDVTLNFPRVDGTAGQVLTTDGSGQLSWQSMSGSSGWLLTGNAGTDGGTNNFIGTTDAQDFVVKTNGNQIARFGQNGNVAIGSSNIGLGLSAPSAIGDNSIAFGIGNTALGIASTVGGYSSTASGDGSVAFGGEVTANGSNAVAFGDKSRAIADGSTAFGLSTTASGLKSTVFGVSSISSGDESIAIGSHLLSRSFGEVSLGISNVDYLPLNINAFNQFDRSFSIGNGGGSPHNAYTLWKDGSFAYNDDNFQNDNPGTEQNMFYFNYGNHDGLGGVNTKRAIRLGSTLNDEWDINSTNVGNKSISLGFVNDYDGFPTSIASGQNSITIGDANIASEQGAIAIGSAATADGVYSIAIGQGSHASSLTSTALGYGSFASGNRRSSLGDNAKAVSANEVSLGMNNTSYVPISIGTWQGLDRLISIGNGDGSFVPTSDAFTILKNGQTGIGIDNFETNTNGNIFQVGDGSTNIIGYVDDITGNWVAVSDERKKDNITDLTYGLDQVLQLRPTSFDYKRNHEHTIGFIAQQVLPIIPEAVYGTESEGYGMSYATLTPVIVKAIQEMNLKITDIGNTETPNTWRDALIAWFANTTNGITEFIAGTVRAKNNICIDDVCIDKEQLRTLLQNNNITPSPSPIPGPTGDDDVVSSGNDDQTLPVDNPSDDGTDTGSSDQVVTPSTDTPAPVDTSTPIE